MKNFYKLSFHRWNTFRKVEKNPRTRSCKRRRTEKDNRIDRKTFRCCRFQLNGDELLLSNVTKHRILTVNYHPVNTKQYCCPYDLREEAEKQVNEVLEKGII